MCSAEEFYFHQCSLQFCKQVSGLCSVKRPKELQEGSGEQRVSAPCAAGGAGTAEQALLREAKPVANPSREREKPHSSH